MIPYASRTGTRANLDALRLAGWRLMLSPAGVLRTEGFKYALDNGAWSAFAQNTEWNEDAFCDALERFGPGSDFVVVPDIVMGGAASLERSRTWIKACLEYAPVALIAVQNGMLPSDIADLLSPRVGVFIGGDDTFKEDMAPWATAARAAGAWCHVGRVNSQRRVRLCQLAGVDSFDGSGVSRFKKHIAVMERALAQPCFFFPQKCPVKSPH